MALAAVTLAACSSGPSYTYYRVSSRYMASAQGEQAPEIIPTPAYTQFTGSARTVAVRAPDRCSNATTNQATGNAASAGTILQTNCGVEMGEIERALTRAGYNVISWNVLDREMAGNKSPVEIASKLGAQVLFQINSLENSRKTLGQDALWERSYYMSSPSGAIGQPLSLAPAQRNLVAKNYLTAIEAQSIPRAYAVTLDAVAVWVQTGQSIWYYRWTHSRAPEDAASGYNVLLTCLDGVLSQCQTNQIRRAVAQAPGQAAAGETVAVSISERPEDAERAIFSELYKEVVSDFVTSFARNKSNARPAPAPAPIPRSGPAPAPSLQNW
ncbi:hypothetical protein [Emcibacter sp. SYSU 3D8]|uniref:hypothetical protein n=1 Tax=Emcibacter sp. SYSU 3D8 TaxID=3133969 RepID=UPI0031FEAC54